MDPSPLKPRLPLVIAATTGVQALATLSVLAVPTIAPSVAAALGVSPVLVGFQVSAIYCAAALTSATAGTVVMRWGACRTSQVAMLMVAAGCVTASVGSLAPLAVAAIFIGVGYGLTNPASSHLLMRFTPERHRNFVFSLKQTGVPIGGVVAGLALPTLALSAGWRAALTTIALAALLMATTLLPLRRVWDDDRRPRLRLRGDLLGGPRLVWQVPALRALAVVAFSFSALQLCLMTFLVTMLTHDLAFSLVVAGLASAGVQVAGACGRVFWGFLADRTGAGRGTLLTIGALSTCCSLGVAAIGVGLPRWLTLPLLVLFGLSSIGWNGVFLAEVARRSPSDAVGKGTGGALFFTFGGVVIGPALFAILHGLIGEYTLTFAVMALFPAAGSLILTHRRYGVRPPGKAQ